MKHLLFLGVVASCLGLGMVAQAQTVAATPPPKIAVILPLQSTDFSRAAQAVLDGVEKARQVMGEDATLISLETDDTQESLLAAFNQAQEAGANLVIGPLTRRAATVVAMQPESKLLTLALNAPDSHARLATHFWAFSLSIEAEARQMVELAWKETSNRQAALVTVDTALSRRAGQAFAEGFLAKGGNVVLHVKPTDPNLRDKLSTLPEGTVLFLATDTTTAREVLAYTQKLNVFGVSLLYEGRSAARSQNLDGVRFTDQPWMLQPDHPAVMLFARDTPRDRAERERLYALGLDAWRVALELVRGHTEFDLDGVTGQLTARAQRIERRATVAVFRDGLPVVVTD
jgi:outer membrane PBP1 activator LpoA protein